MKTALQKKVNRAIKLIQAASKIAKDHGQVLEIAYSGGKDSDVILELAKMSKVNFVAIYKNTTIDPPGTIKHAKEAGAIIRQPETTFFELISKNSFPTRYRRFCCRKLKEYKINDYVVIGIRREESTNRTKRYQEPEACRVFNKTEKARQYYPLLDWTNEDVAEFVKERNIKCHKLYYDEDGSFHPERRLGCMCCPMAYYKKRIDYFLKYPKMVKAYIIAGGKYFNSHPQSKTVLKYKTPYNLFVRDVFCTSDQQYIDIVENCGGGLFENFNCKDFLQGYFKIEL